MNGNIQKEKKQGMCRTIENYSTSSQTV